MKVADMGICANPATQKTKNKQGIRQFVPECLNYNASLTNKVMVCVSCAVFPSTCCIYRIIISLLSALCCFSSCPISSPILWSLL